MGQTSRETWSKRVARWKASGLRAKEFGAKFGIKPKSLEWWKWRLGADTKGQRRSKKSARRIATAISPVTFVEMATAPINEPLELVLANGARIRVSPGFDGATLLRLLDVVERRP
jgi:hypothetical protein